MASTDTNVDLGKAAMGCVGAFIQVGWSLFWPALTAWAIYWSSVRIFLHNDHNFLIFFIFAVNVLAALAQVRNVFRSGK